MKIIVRAPNWLGDAVMALPVLTALRTMLPQAEITVACRQHLTAVFAAAAGVDQVAAVPAGSFALARHAFSLRSAAYDYGILLTNSFATAAWLRLSGTQARIGYARDARSWLLTQAVTPTAAILAAHQAEYYYALLRELPIGTVPEKMPLPQLILPAATEEEAAGYLRTIGLENRSYAVIAPCSAFGAVKDWRAERYAEVARALVRERGLDVLVTGTGKQREQIARVFTTEETSPHIHNAAGVVSLAGLFALLRRAAVFIGGDSGAAHAAAALGTPAAVIFGITEPSRTRPLGDVHKIQILGAGGISTPDLRSPAVAAAARQALDAVSAEEVTAAAVGLLLPAANPSKEIL